MGGYYLNLKEIGWDGVDFINLGQDRDKWRDLVNTIMDPQVS
jgi:hypothetical protein